MDPDDASIRWQRLGRLIREQRLAMGLTQGALGDRAGVSIQTVNRVEMGKVLTRAATSWPKLETALGWPQGFIADYLAGDADELALAGRFRRDPVPEGDITGMIHDMMFEVFGYAAPETPLSAIREAERIALEVAKKHGYVPALRQDRASDDQTGEGSARGGT